MRKIAIIFPGLGYHPDKPLLYYGKKLAAKAGYELIEVRYGGFAYGVKGNPEKMKAAFLSALSQAEEILSEKGLDSFKSADLLFISKSIGTAVAAAYQKKHNLPGRHIYYTPVEETFQFAQKASGIAFHGTADSWASTGQIMQRCKEMNIPLFITEEADHSMETGNVIRDLKIMNEIMEECERYI